MDLLRFEVKRLNTPFMNFCTVAKRGKTFTKAKFKIEHLLGFMIDCVNFIQQAEYSGKLPESVKHCNLSNFSK